MASCGDIQPLITACVDAEASPGDRAVVADHLRGCAACRARAADEEAGRRIMRERAAAFRVEAPAALRARCQPRRAGTRSSGWFAVHPMPVWAVAVLVLTVLTSGLFIAGRTPTVFAAELAADHLKCFTLFEKTSGPGDPEVIAERLKSAYGWTIRIPGTSERLGLRLVGGRRCLSTDGRVAHILYRHFGRPLSFFVVPRTTRRAAQLAVAGNRAIMWAARGNTYVVLATESQDELAPVAAYMKAIVEGSSTTASASRPR